MATSAEQALETLNVVSPDLVLTYVQLGAMSGIELCARLKADTRDTVEARKRETRNHRYVKRAAENGRDDTHALAVFLSFRA